MHRNALAKGGELVLAGEALLDYLDITRRHGPCIPPADHQRITESMLRFLSLRERAGISFKPKMHLCLHLVVDIG
eukprot:11216129-Lingulodinium_polyedra.AAC.1